MALATSLLPGEPGGALATLLSQGVSALNQAVTNAINVGRDRATTQLNQENTIFSVLKNQRDLDMRKAENLRRNFETDRLFGRTVARDVREDFTKDRDFYRDVFTQDRSFGLQTETAKRADEAAKRTDAHYTTTEQQRRQELELRSQQMGANLLRLQEEQKQTDILRSREADLSSRAIGSTTADALASPQAASTLTTPDLENYVDIFGPSRAPEVQGRVAAARRELSRRDPTVDPETGKKIPDRFAPDKDRRAISSMPPQEQLYNATQLSRFLRENEARLADPKFKGPAKATLLKELADAEERLSLFPAEVQEAARTGALTPATVAPGTVAPSDYFK